MSEDGTCNLCGSSDFAPRFSATDVEAAKAPSAFACTNVGHGQHGPIVECRDCGLVFAHPMPSSEVLNQAYAATQDQRYAEEEPYRVLNFRPLADLVERHRRPPGRLLDVGCHIGTFLELAREHGWSVHGVEPSRWAAKVAADRGLAVDCGSLQSLSDPRPFDVITMWDVIEHVRDPMAELCAIEGLLNPGGWLFFSTIDIGSLFARVLGRRWPWLMHMHLYYFRRDHLARYVEEAGFEVVEMSSVRRIVSAAYALEKAHKSLRLPTGRLAAALRDRPLGQRAVGIRTGDIVLVVARKKGSVRVAEAP